MAETKWAPGPWSISANYNRTGEISFHSIHSQPVGESTFRPFVCSTWGGPNEGNANLIAAAPELYEALANLVPRFERACKHLGTEDEYITLAVKQAVHALAKARGETGPLRYFVTPPLPPLENE